MTEFHGAGAGQVFEVLGHAPQIDATAYLAPGALVIGRVRLGPRVSVWCHTVLRGDLADIVVGAGSNIQDNTTVHVEGSAERADGRECGTVIGANVTIGHNCIIHSCTLEDEVLIGMGAIVMGGARIGRGAIVGAGAVVLEETVIPPYSLAVGSPARVKKTYTPAEVQELVGRGAGVYQQRIEWFRAGLKPVR